MLPQLPQLLLQLVDLLTLLPHVLLLLPLLPQMLPPLLLLAATAAVAAAQLLLLMLPLLLLQVTTRSWHHGPLWGSGVGTNEICTSIASCGFRLDNRRPGALRFKRTPKTCMGGGAAVRSEIRRPYGRRRSGVRTHHNRQLLNKKIEFDMEVIVLFQQGVELGDDRCLLIRRRCGWCGC